MHEEAKFREEIQERTGISSRGFLIPNRKVREEVQGILSAGNRRNEVKAEHAVSLRRELRKPHVGRTGSATARVKRDSLLRCSLTAFQMICDCWIGEVERFVAQGYSFLELSDTSRLYIARVYFDRYTGSRIIVVI